MNNYNHDDDKMVQSDKKAFRWNGMDGKMHLTSCKTKKKKK